MITQLEIAQSLGYIDEFDSCNELAQEVGRMLTSLMKKYDSIRTQAGGRTAGGGAGHLVTNSLPINGIIFECDEA